jgi:hypothetical protein
MFMTTKIRFHYLLIITLALLGGINRAQAQGTLFTYQGRLETNAVPLNGFYDFEFSLWTNSGGTGTQVGTTQTTLAVGVTNGLFVVTLNFGAVFAGNATWMAISTRSNATGSYVALTPLQELTPTPYAIFSETASNYTGILPSGGLSGTYGDAVTLDNTGNVIDGNGSGLTSLNASALTSGTVSAARLPSDVAYLDVNQSFSASNAFSGPGQSFIVNGGGTIATNLFTGLSIQYNANQGESAFQSAFNDGYSSISLWTKQGPGFPIDRQVFLDRYGNVVIDYQGANNGVFNNGTTNGVGLSFGSGSGEGIASERQASTPNQFGVDFYTDFTQRMLISHSGNVSIPTLGSSLSVGIGSPLSSDAWFDVFTPVTNTWGGMWMETAGAGMPFYGYAGNGEEYAYTWFDGSSGGNNSWDVYAGGAYLALTTEGLGVNLGYNVAPSQAMEVSGNWVLIDGADADNGDGAIDAYIGGNGSGSDVQVGSLNPDISNVAFYNWGNGTWMRIACGSIAINGGSDLAEPFAVSSSATGKIPEGSVVVIDDKNPGRLKVSTRAYDTRVAGVLSGANGIHPGIQMQQQGLLDGDKNVALTGRVYVLADATKGAINPGDLLTTSDTPGHAMKVKSHSKAQGAILGKAMTGLKSGKGMVLVLVTLQ